MLQEVMQDPVTLLGDGHTYERAAIEDWLARGNKSSPMTGAALTDQQLVPNLVLKTLAEQLRQL